MRVLMFGWEFPPYSSGGLGTACEGIVKGLSNKGIEIIFVAPKTPKSSEKIKFISAFDNVTFKHIPSLISSPYMTEEDYKKEIISISSEKRQTIYGRNLFHEVYLFSERAKQIAKKEKFDIIHAHDWLTFKAGIKAKEISKKPLVIHVHATEFDRTGGNGINPYVYDIEKEGMQKADKIIAVSNYTKNIIVSKYGIDPEKVEVAHNAVDFTKKEFKDAKIGCFDKIVLFLGRITLQKGPDYFIYAAKRVIDVYPNAKFVVVGSGDMEPFIIEKAAELGIADKVLFAGFLQGEDVDRAYQMADVYVMPSVSEPFGITPLEALKNNVPVIISKQSGVSEVLHHALKVDFWDIDELANKIISTLRFSELRDELRQNGINDVRKLSWDITAEKCIGVYNKVNEIYNKSMEGY
ncbi:MAG: glycosyltransferase family 4 protein [Candidatus Woesearchaeota archaeon]|nr:glycosyltransferase family 4 protein [Candidatus Woesearchaeota archaeon]